MSDDSSITAHSIGRSISQLGFRLHDQREKKSKEGASSALTETDQQFQVEVTGNAGPLPTWETIEVDFDETIYQAPAQRDNPLEEPHFTFGSSMQSDLPVILHATVREWKQDSAGNFTGAIVHIGASGSSSEQLTRFKARVHLTFQGFSSPNYPVTGEGEG
jgi:hypothetical protein